jgi:hypothetical protein
MPIDTTQLVDYAWLDIAKAAKSAMIAAALGGANYTIHGKSFGRITPQEARDLYDFAISMDNAEKSGPDGSTVLVRINDPM